MMKEAAMIDKSTRKPLYVSANGTAGPYIMVPVDQLAAVTRLLDDKRVRYWTDEVATKLDELKLAAVARELHELSYKDVREWFIYLGEIVKLDCPSPDQIERLAE